MAHILVADDEAGLREFISDVLDEDGHTVHAAADGEAAAKRLDQQAYQLLITDLNMPKMGGMELLQKARSEAPEMQVIVLTAHGTVETAVAAMKAGAFDYLQKPVSSPDELSLLVGKALEHRRLLDRSASADRSVPTSFTLSYGDPAMGPVVSAVDKVAPTDATVLLLGQSGTGKEVVAKTVHEKSPRSAKPFMAINCAALAETLLESELFGHEKGAFTGATERRRGAIELADGGTFFLDEIGEMKAGLQAKLLRVLQERSFKRVGGSKEIHVDVRIVAATNRDLPAMIQSGEFREDLYHRLAVFPIQLPALKDRPGDILPMANALLPGICADLKRPMVAISDAAKARLTSWSFPGNVRELRNLLERAVILVDGSIIEPSHLVLGPQGVAAARSAESVPGVSSEGVRPLSQVEKDAIANALAHTDGNRRKAAELLEIGERTLYDKIKKYGLN